MFIDGFLHMGPMKTDQDHNSFIGIKSLIEPTLRELQSKMREAENDPHDGKRKCEALWPIFKIAHQKSRYIFDLYHQRKEISKELFEFCLDQGYADRNIIAKWKNFRLQYTLFEHDTVCTC
ncbi:protein BUD31 homolog 2-like [Humulus lupulus]|uniref:protein BUD31 homolog 2-like n=1 Tax=Humulus lupulus TaxID=3486 RepID=UPI002B4184D0|nr:protein BUD31 homolog 2-like [Humulus lupulus]